MKPATFLDKLPLEIREKIYCNILALRDGEYYDCHIGSPENGHCCPLDLLLCNRQVNREFRRIWRMQEIYLSSCHDTGRIKCSLPCFHGLSLSSTSVRFDINPFQHKETILELWNSIALLCTVLTRAKKISKLDIFCDGTLPRKKPPLHINEDDLERGPLNIVLLLQPFRLLAHVQRASISILGGPLNDPWSRDTVLQTWTQRYARNIESPPFLRVEQNNLLANLSHQLKGEGLLWDIALYRAQHQKLLSESFMITN